MTSIRFNVQFARQSESRLTAPPSPPCAPAAPSDEPSRAAPTASPIARLLARAHHVERLVEDGELKDYADAGKRLDMCASHVTHMMALLQLAPDIQTAILEGSLMTTERALRPVCLLLSWDEQRSAMSRMDGTAREAPACVQPVAPGSTATEPGRRPA